MTLVGLGAFALSQPILSDLRAGAGYFVARRVESPEILLLVVSITLAPGIVANLIVWIAGLFSAKLRAWTEAGIVGIFVILLVQTLIIRVATAPWIVLLTPPIAIGTLTAVTYYLSDWLRDAFAWLIPVPLIIAGFFLLTPPVFHLVFPPTLTAVEVDTDPKAPVVFIVLDELPVVSLLNRAGEIDADRYPNFATLAEMSTWYKYTAAAHDSTLWAIPALLTGEVSYPSRLPTTADYPGNLFTLLNRSHELHVEESFTHLCPPEMCDGAQTSTTFRERFGSLLRDTARLYAMMIAPDLPESEASVSDPFNGSLDDGDGRVSRESFPGEPARFDEFLDGVTAEDSSLYYAHVPLPHIPYRYYPSGRQYLGGSRLDGQEDELWFEQALAEQAYLRHLLQVQYVDRLIGNLLARLDQVGILDEAILVVTADHGASFRADTSRRAIGEENAYEIGIVPLFIKAPHQSFGVIDTTPARAIDVVPTVAAYLGIELPWLHQGQSLTRDPRTHPQLKVQAYRGDEVELDHVAEGVLDASEYAYSLFGDGSGRIDPYALGEYDGLIDRAPEEVSTGESALDVRVEDLWRLAHVAARSRVLPGFVRGEVIGDLEPDTHMAIALNGRIRTVVPLLEEDDTAQFSAILSDHAFVPGFNELSLMAVSGPDESPDVKRIGVDGHYEFRLEPDESGGVERLVDNDGHTWEITEEPVMNGQVDATEWYPNEAVGSSTRDLFVVGWAVDTLEIRPAERVVFFVDGVFGGSAGPDIERPDIVRGYDDREVLLSGFRGPVSSFSPTENCELRVFALSGGSAIELGISERARSSFLGC